MSPRFLNERLVTTQRFAPRDPPAIEQGSPVQPPAPTAQPDEPDVEELVRVEHSEIRRAVTRSERAELERLHGEVAQRLREAIAEQERDRHRIQAQLDVLHRQLDSLGDLGPLPETDAGPEALRQWKRHVHSAHMELLKVERDQADAPDQRHLLMSLTWGDLTRLGWGLTWPLIVALLLAAGIVVGGVFVALGV